MNSGKSEDSLGGFCDPNTLADFPFKWYVVGFKYLGLKISPDTRELYKLNFASVLTAVKQDLIRWHDPPLSLIGHISLMKKVKVKVILFIPKR